MSLGPHEYESALTYEFDDTMTVTTELILPNSMFVNGIAIQLGDTSNCQKTKLGKMAIKFCVA